MNNIYDIIVVGAGHAGCEAASAAARLGSKVLLITMDMNKIAQMSCNPAMGGIAKGQIIREIDALGGFSGIVSDASTIQFRMLNKSKGPAMWSPRAQCDRTMFIQNWRFILENTCNLDIWQDTVTEITFSGLNISGVHTAMGSKFKAKTIIITAGTFLNGRLFIGQQVLQGGRIGEPSSYHLTEQLKERGVITQRMKTGTPPRIDIRSLDLSNFTIQNGDEKPSKFSYLNYYSPIQKFLPQKPCFIAHTNKVVHEILAEGFPFSPLFSGKISGIGPRYCPSIEDKLRTFAGKDEHQLFLEPEGRHTNEYYLQGFSSSLPLEVQLRALKEIKGFEKVKIFRPAYAVEYDYFDPTLLFQTMESKIIPSLFFAGQVNGTTGYEEAAAQGLIAGINAHLKLNQKTEFLLTRDSSYIGVLIDDLITKGVDEPYRMFTSRAEYRILLRQDNADQRLTEISYKLGLADEYRYKICSEKYSKVDKTIDYFNNNKPPLEPTNILLKDHNSSSLNFIKSYSEILSRPQISIDNLLKIMPDKFREDLSNNHLHLQNPANSAFDIYSSLLSLLFLEKLNVLDEDSISTDILSSVEIIIKYKGYIEREKQIASKIHRLESVVIPENFDYSKVSSLSMESRLKLIKHKPTTIAQASRIPGVSPADISVLLVYFGR